MSDSIMTSFAHLNFLFYNISSCNLAKLGFVFSVQNVCHPTLDASEHLRVEASSSGDVCRRAP